MSDGTFYEGEEWRAERERVLAQRGEQCERCGDWPGAPHVHHVRGLASRTYQVLCPQCHAEVHGRDEIADFDGQPTCSRCGAGIRWKSRTSGKRFPVDATSGRPHECRLDIPFVPLGREPDLVYGEGEVPLQCAFCGVELVTLRRPVCGPCYAGVVGGKTR